MTSVQAIFCILHTAASGERKWSSLPAPDRKAGLRVSHLELSLGLGLAAWGVFKHPCATSGLSAFVPGSGVLVSLLP